MRPTRLYTFAVSTLTVLTLLAASLSGAAAATYNATYQASDILVAPSISGKTVPVILTNTGTATWDTSGSYYLTYHIYQGSTLITWSGMQTVPPTSVPPGASLMLAAKISSPAAEGAYTIQWDMVGPSGLFSGLGTPTGNVNMTVSVSAPSITSMTPSSAVTGSADTSLTVTGSNVTPDLIVHWNGVPLATTYTDATHLNATIPASDLAAPGSALITVANGTGHSTSATFTITYPSPTISALTPNSTPSGSGDLAMTITGTNFYPGSSAYGSNINGNSGYLASTVVSSTQLTAVLPAGWMLTPGSGTIIVRTPDRLRSSNSRSVTITQAPPVLESISPSSSFAGQAGITLTLTGGNFITGATAYWNGAALPTTPISPTELTASLSAGAIATAGTASVSIVASSGSSGSLTFTILSTDQTLTFPPIPDKTMADGSFTITATASSGLPVSLVATGECSLSASMLTLTGEGTCSVTASQAGNATYNPAPSVTNAFVISKLDQAITFNPIADQPANTPPFTVAATASSGLPIRLAATGTCTLSGSTLTLTGSGTCTVTASQAGNATYNPAADVTRSFLIGKAGQVITFDPIPDTLISQASLTVTPLASSGLPVSLTTSGPCVVDTQTIMLIDFGTCAVTASQPGDETYEAAASVTRSFAINRLGQSITFDPIPDKQSTELPFSVSATASSGLPVTFLAAGSCAISNADVLLVDSGVCTITAEQPGDDAYEPAPPVSRAFAINKLSQTITFDPLADKLTIDAPFAVVATASSGLPIVFTADGPCSVSNNTVDSLRVGLCTVTASQPGNQVYAFAEQSRSFSITSPPTSQIPLTLTPLAQTSSASVSTTFTWPEIVTGTLHRVNCGTLREQIIAGRTGTCVYTRPGTYKLQGRFTPTDGGTDTTLAPTSITVPSIAPAGITARLTLVSEGSLTETADSQSGAPAYHLVPKAYPPVLIVTADPTPPSNAPPGILDSLDPAQSIVTINDTDPATNVPSSDPPHAVGKLRFNTTSRLYATALQLRGKRQADKNMFIHTGQSMSVVAKTTSGTTLTTTSPIAIAHAVLTPIVKVTASSGPYAPASYRFRVTTMDSPIKRDRIAYLWTVTTDNDPTPLRQAAGTQGLSVTFDTPGTYHVALSVKGALSDESVWNTTIVVPPDPDPSTAAIRVTVDGINRSPVAYSFHAILPTLPSNDRYTKVEWTIDGQAPSYRPNRHLFTTPGPHAVHVTATTANNTMYTADTVVTVEPNMAPTGQLDCSQSVTATANAVLKCNALASDPDGRIARWRWVVPQLSIDIVQNAALRVPIAQPPQFVTVECHITDNSSVETVLTADVPLGAPQAP